MDASEEERARAYEYEFRAVTAEDLERERIVETFVAEHLAEWQAKGLGADMRIEPGDKTDEPIRDARLDALASPVQSAAVAGCCGLSTKSTLTLA